MLGVVGPVLFGVVGVAGVVWGAETFAEHLARASARLGVSTFALALLLAGAEPEEFAHRGCRDRARCAGDRVR